MPETGAFINFWRAGYRSLLPIVPPGATISERSTLYARKDAVGKIPGVRGHDGAWRGMDWQRHATSEGELETWSAWGAGVGLRLGDGLLALDVDTLDPFLAETAWRVLQEVLPGAHARRYGRKPKWLTLLRCAEPIKYTRVEFDGYEGMKERIELLGVGRQCVVAGVHPVTGKTYEWEPAVPGALGIAEASAAQIGALFARLKEMLPGCSAPLHESAERPQNQELLRGKLEDVRKAVGALPNTTDLFPTRNDYLKVGYAIKAALPDDEGEAEDLFLQWCGRWSDDPHGRSNEIDGVLADWRRMKPPYGVGAGWLYEMADRHGVGVGFSMGELWFDPVVCEEERRAAGELVFGLDTEQEQGQEGVGGVSSAQKPLRMVKFGDAADQWQEHGARPLVKGLLDAGAMCVLYGASNLGKTFVAMDLAAHVAMGKPWAGMPVYGGCVVYVVAEGAHGAYKRAAAYVRKYGAALKTAPFYLLTQPVDLLRPAGDIRALVDACKQVAAAESAQGAGPCLIVLDTLSRVMAGGDENSAVDMGALVRHFDALRAATGAHVMVVHHTGKDESKGARGHSLLRAATDTELELTEGRLTATKQRDLDKAVEVRFVLEGEIIGLDPEGDKVTSATVKVLREGERADTGLSKPGDVTAKEQTVLDAVYVIDATNEGGKRGASLQQIGDYFAQKMYVMHKDTVRTHLRNLAAKGRILPSGRGIWAPKAVEMASTALLKAVEHLADPVESGRETVDGVFD